MFSSLNPESNRFTTFIPLVIVYIVTALKQGMEDWKRYQADRKMNGRVTHVRARHRGAGPPPGAEPGSPARPRVLRR